MLIRIQLITKLPFIADAKKIKNQKFEVIGEDGEDPVIADENGKILEW